MHILYKITYIPHLNTSYPKYYVGSKYNYSGNYYGSISSKQVFDYTNGMTLVDWWKTEKKTKENFIFEILEIYDNISANDLVLYEKELHLKLNVLSEEYFNQSIATKGFCSVKKSKNTKVLMSESAKIYWATEEGLCKKQRLIDRNLEFQSDIMIKKWKSPSNAMKNRVNHGRPKGSKDIKVRSKKPVYRIKYKDMIFDSAIDAANYVGINPVNIRRKCRTNYMNEWSYV